MVTGTSSPTDVWDVAGDDEPEMDDEAILLEPRFRSAFRIRLLLLDSLFFILLLDLTSRSDLWEGEGLLGVTWTSELPSRFPPEGREPVGDEGGLRKGCWPLESSKRKKAVTAVHPE